MAGGWKLVHSRLDGEGARAFGADGTAVPLADGQTPAQGTGPAVWLVTAEDLVLTERPWTVRRRDLEQALPYALEEDLVDEPGDYALAYVAEGGRIHVAAANRAKLQAGYAALRGRGIAPRAIIPDVLCLPRQGDAWTLLVEGERAMVRTGDYAGFACRRENLPFLIARAVEEAEPRPEALVAHGDIGGLPELPIPVRPDSREEPVALLARHAVPPWRLNLLAQAGAGHVYRPGDRRRLMAAATLAVVTLGLFLGTRWYEVVRLRADTERLDGAIEAAYREAFPEQSRVVNARLQMEQQLRALRGGGEERGFLPILHGAREQLGPDRGVSILALRYGGDALSLSVDVGGLQALDRLKQALEKGGGLRVTVEAVEKIGDGVRADLRLAEGQS